MSRFSLIVVLSFLIFGVSAVYLQPAVKDVEITIGAKRHRVDFREMEGRAYFDLEDIANVFDLKLEEEKEQISVTGPRGRLVLTHGRPLVQFEEQYILLSEPVWKRKNKDWYVSEDFLTVAAPLILSLRLERIADRSYRSSPLEVNRIKTLIANYPDHVRVVFQPSQKTPVRVREFRNYLQVEFGDYLLEPEVPSTHADARIIASMDLRPKDARGALRIYKGPEYYNFREFALSGPDRKVIDLYAPPVLVVPPEAKPAVPEAAPEPPPAPARSIPDEAPLVFQRLAVSNSIAIDPGHGGEDYGVLITPDVVEKNLAVKISERIGARLKSGGLAAFLTRSRDAELSLEQRSAAANSARSRAFISIHAGGSPSPEVRGPVVYVQRYGSDTPPGPDKGLILWREAQRFNLENSKKLAAEVQKELNALYGVENGVVEAPLALLAPLNSPAILVEVGFLTNSEDSEKLASPDFQDQIAATIVAALLRFFKAVE
ncbi:MAG: N-acetylmuramoyl-L-alanine amidase [Acidobacteria bacterium]|nr:N-acetylmuramoyl-L-alanine amidase [Acidobacteriota bacterium]